MIYLQYVIWCSIIAGAYGALHDLITYQISAEYFTHLKFEQFGLPWGYRSPKWGAFFVGFLASWWVGAVISSFLGLLAWRLTEVDTMPSKLIRAFSCVLLITFLCSVIGYIYAHQYIQSFNLYQYKSTVPDNLNHPVAFARVGVIHNASYLGGILGSLLATIYLCKRKSKKTYVYVRQNNKHKPI